MSVSHRCYGDLKSVISACLDPLSVNSEMSYFLEVPPVMLKTSQLCLSDVRRWPDEGGGGSILGRGKYQPSDRVWDPGVSNSSAKMEVEHGWISPEPHVGFRAMKIIRHYLKTSLAIS